MYFRKQDGFLMRGNDKLESVEIIVSPLKVIQCTFNLRKNNIKYRKIGLCTFVFDADIYPNCRMTEFIGKYFNNMKINYIYKWVW